MNPIDSKLNDSDLDRIKFAARTLGEYFDTVQIFCTRHGSSADGTTHFQFGLGSWFARIGHITYWMWKQKRGAQIEMDADQEGLKG